MRRTRILTTVLALAAGLLAGSPPALAAEKAEKADKSVSIAADSYTWKNARIDGGGFVPGIVFNRKERNLAYARTDIGGAYRWVEASKTWTPLLDSVGWDDWGHTGVVSLASDSVDPNKVYVAAGTYTNSWDPGNGAILRSSDRGASWQKTNLPFKLGGNMPGRGMGERLAVDPNRNSVLYLGAPSGKGLWRSTDSGVTWSQVTNFPNVGNYVADPSDTSGYSSDNQGIVWVTFDETTGTSQNATRTLYVGVADKDNAVYRSTDAGATWSRVAGQPTGYLAHKGVLDATNGHLYLSYSDKGGPYDGGKGQLWRYATATGSWTNISPVAEADTYYGFSGLTVDRQDPGTVMATAYSSWWPDTQIFRSTDSGATWTKAWDYTSYPNRANRFTMDVSSSPWLTWGANPSPPEQTPKLGWMTEALEIDPFNSSRMMYGTGATIYGTENLGNWDSGGQFAIKPMVQGLEETAVNDLASPPSGAPLLSALGDIGGFRHTDLTKVPSMMFTQPNFTTTTSLDYAESNPNTVVRVGNLDSGPHIAFSTDNGANWFAGTDPSGVSGGGTVAAAADGSRFVWSPAGTGVRYATGFGNSWSASSGIPADAIVESDRVDPKTFYGFKSGKFYVSTDGGATFTASNATNLPSGDSVRFKALPGAKGDVWLAGGAADGAYGLWHSTDGGATWTKLPGVEQADTIGFGKAAAGASYQTLYTSARIGGVRGIFRSTDKGATWTRINDDAHQWGWTGAAITGDPRVYGRVYVSTNGRGVVYGDSSDTGGGGGGTDPDPEPEPTGACAVTYKVTSEWSGGFQADVRLSNTGTSAWTGWSLGWTFPNGQSVSQLWNAAHTQSGSAVTARNIGWNGNVAAGSSVSFGFTGSWSGTNGKPAAFKLGDQSCAVT
ncbi:cellulose binding domain-containing protein [Streptomyces europaeiscabiei]|uniref:Cellulose binding domain-containing protein n=1 Tax=Streptomyces europaeiscabiei TaxID=146819 RepID=A0ABU4N6E5_9ACTN|nr:cellulose binding domain-containing protein [Streptomyces europaeiscabiei]MDX2527021.1 cellulose binding domain-containing protein [Streptomyces europaeiscabiei]MDX3542086.1 cellulose binding domain-containing protein [Streptomyces europaeiscabiei]MDX3551134.1 cellulose binding domain-containing protein [Streptomyces europaeiscabiei]MDX3665305.1 cellulose binding domain-containing protein [Streptomyces europaeiscabiei]MDX3698306.1 cellulose binding domain-containing protein [Streptomyces eu